MFWFICTQYIIFIRINIGRIPKKFLIIGKFIVIKSKNKWHDTFCKWISSSVSNFFLYNSFSINNNIIRDGNWRRRNLFHFILYLDSTIYYVLCMFVMMMIFLQLFYYSFNFFFKFICSNENLHAILCLNAIITLKMHIGYVWRIICTNFYA